MEEKNYIVLFAALFIIGGAYAMEEEPVAQKLPTPQSFPDSIQQPDPNNNNTQREKRKCFFCTLSSVVMTVQKTATNQGILNALISATHAKQYTVMMSN